MASISEFKKKVLRLNEPKEHEVTNSYGLLEGYRYLRKNNKISLDIPYKNFSTIIKEMNKVMGKYIANGEEMVLPQRMGKIEIRRYEPGIRMIDGKPVPYSMAINWKETLKLWEIDEESRKNKVLVRYEDRVAYKLLYNKSYATYKNKMFYKMNINRGIKKSLSANIKNNKIDAFGQL